MSELVQNLIDGLGQGSVYALLALGIAVIFGVMHLLNFAVDPPLQGRGIGGFLMDWMLAEAARNGYRRVSLEVRASNESAIALYTSRGFRRVFVRKGYYTDNDEDALIMVCDLEAPDAR